MAGFAAFIPVGPGASELERLSDLWESFCTYEPSVSTLVIVDNGSHRDAIKRTLSIPRGCDLVVLLHPRLSTDRPPTRLGDLWISTVDALNHLRSHAAVEFVLKLDTDSLVIAPFADKIRAALARHPNAGMLGALGTSCNDARRSFQIDAAVAGAVITALDMVQRLDRLSDEEIALLRSGGIQTNDQISAFEAMCKLLSSLRTIPFQGRHCQGGAYAVTSSLIHKMSAAGFLTNPEQLWDFCVAEDQMVGLACSVLRLDIVDLSAPGEPFGVQCGGLAYPPEQLLEYRYSVIHSVKNDSSYPEDYVRRFFRGVRHTNLAN